LKPEEFQNMKEIRKREKVSHVSHSFSKLENKRKTNYEKGKTRGSVKNSAQNEK
jgi:hypothetical protein